MSEIKNEIIPQNGETEFYQQVADLLIAARKYAKRQMDNTIAITYYEVGRMIVEREQEGQKRARYGSKLIKGLSEYLSESIGKGFSVVNLKNMRKFYQVYSPSIQQSTPLELEKGQSTTALFEKSNLLANFFDGDLQIRQSLTAQFNLSWTHYQVLMRIENEQARRFYEIEAKKMQWSVKDLSREVGSSLYERLALSRDKDKIMELAKAGQLVENPRDIFKAPYVFEFSGLEERPEYSEDDLETALIDNLQKFLLELGKGFLFEARQKRFSFDEKSFYIDLILYNRLLQCYVVIDLKIGEVEHRDLGQIMMYVNYFDRYVIEKHEKPTIGILLCSKKNDNIVELTLPENANIYAKEYNLYLPDKKLLQRKLTEWVEEFEEIHGGTDDEAD